MISIAQELKTCDKKIPLSSVWVAKAKTFEVPNENMFRCATVSCPWTAGERGVKSILSTNHNLL